MTAVKEACPELLVDSAISDCTEYPCRILWMTDGPAPKESEVIKMCPEYEKAFGPYVRLNRFDLSKQLRHNYQVVSIEPYPRDEQMREFRRQWRGNIAQREVFRLRKALLELGDDVLEPRCMAAELDACVALGVFYAMRGGVEVAREYFQIACDLGSVDACSLLEKF